jgi:hypothetical protein
MADNLDDFLKRAAERREQRAKKQAPAQRPAQQPPPQQLAPPPPRQIAPPPKPLAPAPQRQAPPPQRQAPPPQRQAPQTNRQQQKPNKPKEPKRLTPSIGGNSQLARDVSLADNRMDSHLQDVFNKPVGQLDSNNAKSKTSATHSPKDDGTSGVNEIPIAHQIAAALRDPQSARIAFIASEIFQRRF